MKNKKYAFTLAEVLLVLAIIGVIAAVTIPAIMQQSSEKKFSALSKKAVSTLQNAINLKIATVPIGPGDMRASLFGWLLDGDEDGTNTLKGVDTNASSTVLQTPDGMIFYEWHDTVCTTASTRTNILGCTFWVMVDLNGSDAPTKSTVDNAATLIMSVASGAKAKQAYDIIYFSFKNNGIMDTNFSTSYTEPLNRAKKYLSLQ